MIIFLLSCSLRERIMYRASGVKLVLCCHGKGRRDLSAEHSMQITVGYGSPARGQARDSRARRGTGAGLVTARSCDELPTKLKLGLRVGGPWAEGPGPHPLQGQARAAPSGIRRMLRRAACPPCRAAPTSAGCMPPRARRRRAGRGGRRFRAASRCRATSRAPSCPQALRQGRRRLAGRRP